MESPENIWSKCTINSWGIAMILHKAYKEQLRYNENNSKWEYYDSIEKEWIYDKNKAILKKYFIYDARLNIVNYIETQDDIIDINRLANVSKYLSTHFNLILKEAKEIFS